MLVWPSQTICQLRNFDNFRLGAFLSIYDTSIECCRYLYVIVQGFCSIRENIRASLVEPWFVFWRDRRLRQNTHGETKQALIFS